MSSILHFPFSFIKFTLFAVISKVIAAILCFLIASGAALIIAGIEWCLWKIYVIAIIEWFLHYVIYELFALPIQFIIWCYTNSNGFICLVSIIMLSYCFKQAVKTRNDNAFKKKTHSDLI
jgi:hypothetical protein